MLRTFAAILVAGCLHCVTHCTADTDLSDTIDIKKPLCSFDEQKMLAQINSYRSLHSSPPLQWSRTLASDSRKTANELKRRFKCKLPLYYRDKIGTNYISASIRSFSEELVTRFWYDGHRDYDFKEGGPANRNPNVMSFTEMIWKSTREVGCGVTCCDDSKIMVICRFSPAGNVQGYFTENVLEKIGSSKEPGSTPKSAETQTRVHEEAQEL
ncbi:cap like protein [Babesia gibsoni]|uniref:Cap like protein n=1 Tax=Babesia gibsoni TaxID=33632 RepID=A0AAD8PGB3_BABGI|nr:cap like protein [Babesia gibsoni]